MIPVDERTDLERALDDLKEALYGAVEPVAVWFLDRPWAVVALCAIAIGLMLLGLLTA